MALDTKVDSLLVQTSDIVTDTIVVTGLGFTPKAIIFWWNGRDEAVDTLGRANTKFGLSYCGGATDRRAISGQSEDAVGTSRSDDAARADTCVFIISTAGAIDGLLDLQSLDADGFTMVVDQVFGQDIRAHFLALGGDSLTDVFIGDFLQQDVLGNQSITGVGFQPDFVAFTGVASGQALPSLFDDMQGIVASMVSGTEQGYVAWGSQNGVGTMTTARTAQQGVEAHATASGSGSVKARFEFVSMDADGFTIDHTEEDNDRTIFMCLKGGDYAIGQLATRTDGADIVVSGLGFAPSAAMFMSHTSTEDAINVSQTNSIISIGAASGPTERGARYSSDIDNLATSRVATAVEFDAVYIHTDEAAAPAIDGLMDLKSLDADGFTTVMDDPDPSANFVLFWAFGPAAEPEFGPSGKWKRLRQRIPVQGGIRA